MKRVIGHIAGTLLALSATVIGAAEVRSNRPSKLPELGDASSALFSPEAEKAIGQQLLKQIRSQLPTISDPILKYYTSVHLYRLAAQSELKEVSLHPVLIDSEPINAFAAPGGVIGINLGLYVYSQDVHEYSSVIAHELAHLSQRHFARGVEMQRAATLPTILGMLTGALILAAGGGDAGLAAITASQALAQDSALRYSRGREQEADRIGLSTLVRAQMDPHGMSRMFERMQRAFRFTQRPPEFLLTHPVTESRIADARNQASGYPRKNYGRSGEYQFMRARALVHFAESSAAAVAEARGALKSDPAPHDHYRLALALSRAEEHGEALDTLNVLYQEAPESILLTASLAELQIAANRLEPAMALLEQTLLLNPDNAPISMLYARALNTARRHGDAQTVLQQQSRIRPDDADVWYELAETAGLAGRIIDVHRARAEYFALHGSYQNAIQHLQYARSLLSEDSHHLSLRLEQRIVDLRTQAEAARS